MKPATPDFSQRVAFRVREVPLLVPVSYRTVQRAIGSKSLRTVPGLKGIVTLTEIHRWLSQKEAPCAAAQRTA